MQIYIQKVGARDIAEVLAEDTYEEDIGQIVIEFPKKSSPKKRSCFGCLGKMVLAVVIGMIVLVIIGLLIGDQPPEEGNQESCVEVYTFS